MTPPLYQLQIPSLPADPFPATVFKKGILRLFCSYDHPYFAHKTSGWSTFRIPCKFDVQAEHCRAETG